MGNIWKFEVKHEKTQQKKKFQTDQGTRFLKGRTKKMAGVNQHTKLIMAA